MTKNGMNPDSNDAVTKSRHRRERAARKYRPSKVRLLLVAEAPPGVKPNEPERYFYFENVGRHDDLFRYVVKGVLEIEPTRSGKGVLLSELREEGVFLIDLKRDPVDGSSLDACVPDLVGRCKRLNPDRIILIKTNVYDVAFSALRDANLPVVDERIPFPGSGQQKRFEKAFASALTKPPTTEGAR